MDVVVMEVIVEVGVVVTELGRDAVGMVDGVWRAQCRSQSKSLYHTVVIGNVEKPLCSLPLDERERGGVRRREEQRGAERRREVVLCSALWS